MTIVAERMAVFGGVELPGVRAVRVRDVSKPALERDETGAVELVGAGERRVEVRLERESVFGGALVMVGEEGSLVVGVVIGGGGRRAELRCEAVCISVERTIGPESSEETVVFEAVVGEGGSVWLIEEV